MIIKNLPDRFLDREKYGEGKAKLLRQSKARIYRVAGPFFQSRPLLSRADRFSTDLLF